MNAHRLLRVLCGSPKRQLIVAVGVALSILIVYHGDHVKFPLRTKAEPAESRPTPPFPTAFAGRQLTQGDQTIYNPFHDDNGNGTAVRECVGPHGQILSRKNENTMMSGFPWSSGEFPTPIFGSYEAWKLDRSMCTNRFSRYGAYGYADATPHDWPDDDSFGSNAAAKVNWAEVNWANLQQDCLQRNSDRYQTIEPHEKKIWTLDKRMDSSKDKSNRPDLRSRPGSLPRTAVILRSWLSMKYTENDLQNTRAMIMELSLYSGGEYEVILLVDCQGKSLPKPTNKAAIDRFKKKHLPKELRDMAVFFNKKILQSWYPSIDVHEAIMQYYQPVQIFSHLHPHYEHIWQFEMDSRYTGHYYSLLRQATEFAKRQPRKHLWERNSHFYIPAVHGTWENFTDKVDQDMVGRKSVWGPVPPENINADGEAPVPPVSTPGEDNREWGVGEEADLITWLPHFDPSETDWPFRDRVFNFPQGEKTPRRSAVVAMSRVSARLLQVMHRDKVEKGAGLASEMSCASWALYYGLKAVQVPLPLYHEHEWNPEELNQRANPGEPGKVNAGKDSVWSWNRNHDILLGTNFMFQSTFAEQLYRAWMGYDSAVEWEKENIPLCLPPIFLHPVKNTGPDQTG